MVRGIIECDLGLPKVIEECDAILAIGMKMKRDAAGEPTLSVQTVRAFDGIVVEKLITGLASGLASVMIGIAGNPQDATFLSTLLMRDMENNFQKINKRTAESAEETDGKESV